MGKSSDYENLLSRLRKSTFARDYNNCLKLLAEGKNKLSPSEFEALFVGEINDFPELSRVWFKNRFSIINCAGQLDYA